MTWWMKSSINPGWTRHRSHRVSQISTMWRGDRAPCPVGSGKHHRNSRRKDPCDRAMGLVTRHFTKSSRMHMLRGSALCPDWKIFKETLRKWRRDSPPLWLPESRCLLALRGKELRLSAYNRGSFYLNSPLRKILVVLYSPLTSSAISPKKGDTKGDRYGSQAKLRQAASDCCEGPAGETARQVLR